MNESQNPDGQPNVNVTQPHDRKRTEGVDAAIPEHLKLNPFEERERQTYENPELLTPTASGVQSYLKDAVFYPAYADILTWAGGGQSWRAKRAIISGADVNLCDVRGVTPLHYAVRNGTPAVVRVLMQSGANALARDPSGETPMGLALAKKDEELIDIIKACTHNPQALQAFLDSIPTDDAQFRQLTLAAENARQEKNYPDSEKFFHEALKEAERFGTRDMRVADALKKLGAFYDECGRYAEAEDFYDRFCRTMEKADVNGDFNYADFLVSRAKNALQQQNLKRAERYAFKALHQWGFFFRINAKNAPLCEQALQIFEAIANHQLDTESFYNAAGFYLQSGRLSKAEELYLKAIQHFQPIDPYKADGSFQFLSSLDKLAEIYASQQKNAQAASMREEYARQKIRVGMPDHNLPWR